MSSSSSQNQQIVFAKTPAKEPQADTFAVKDIDTPVVTEGKILIRLSYISVDPYLRGVIRGLKEGQPMTSGVVGEVIESKHASYAVGERVWWYGLWTKVQLVDPAIAEKAQQLSKVVPDTPPSTAIGVLGMPGFTAYVGLKLAACFKKGDIVVVSGAMGAVGSLAGQLAKEWGAKLVIGTAGGPEKCKHAVEKFGFDACIDYRKFDTAEKVEAELRRLSPEGVDLYFENTGGHVTTAVFAVIRKFGRVALCGQISHYNEDPSKPELVPNPLIKCIYTSVRIQGFIQTDYIEHWSEFLKDVAPKVKDGRIKYEETVVEGFEKAPQAFADLFVGKNLGKMVVKV